jgi:hypothetical protein
MGEVAMSNMKKVEGLLKAITTLLAAALSVIKFIGYIATLKPAGQVAA